MDAEVISIGDELTSGQRLDTNSQWLSQKLAELGVRVLYHTTVGDDMAANVRVFREAISRAGLVVCTGGLGPTADDLTRQSLAETLGVELVLDPASLAHIEALFARRRGRPMPESNRIQAMFPAGSRVIPNPHGSAPGIDLDSRRADGSTSRVFSLPGVPAEMKEMWEATVAPAIAAMTGGGGGKIVHQAIRCFGVGESDLEAMLPDIIRRGRIPSVGITASQATLTLRITAEGATREDALKSMEPTIATIHQCLGELVFGRDEEEVHHGLLRELKQRGKTLATIECGTTGKMAHALAEADRDHSTFVGATIAPTLGDSQEKGEAQVVAAAESARSQFGADFGIAIGEFPESTPGQELPSAWIAVVGSDWKTTRELTLTGHPEIIAPRVAKTAMNLLRIAVRKTP